MARPSKPWYRTDRDAWVTRVNGRQVVLAKGQKNRQEAFRAFHKMMGDGKPKEAGWTLRGLVDAFLEWVERERKPATLEMYRNTLTPVAKGLGGEVLVSSLQPYHLTEWVNAKGWGPTTRMNTIKACRRVMNWGKKLGYVQANPFEGIEIPRATTREKILTRAQAEAVLGEIRDEAFRDYLAFVFETGARPSEGERVEAKHVDLKKGVIVMEGKTTGKTGRMRVIYLTGRARAIVERRMARWTEGPIFRNKYGGRWNRDTVRQRWPRLRKKLGLGKEATTESLRHLFITDALEAGVPIASVSQLVGHSDTTMVSRVYSKLHQRTEHLADTADRIARSRICTAGRPDAGQTGTTGGQARDP